MSALKQVVQALDRDSGFQLINDMPLFKAALAEIDARLTALEKHNAPPAVNTGIAAPIGNIDPRLVTTPKGSK